MRFGQCLIIVLGLWMRPCAGEIFGKRPISTLEHTGDGGVAVQFHLSKLSTAHFTAASKAIPLKKDFDFLGSDSLQTFSRPGSPALPYRSFIVEGKLTEAEIRTLLGPKKALSWVPPAAPRRGCRCSPLKRGGLAFDAGAFADSGDLVRAEFLGDYRGTPLSKVTVTPLRYRQEEGLVAFPQMRVEIEGHPLFDPLSVLNQANREMLVAYPDSLLRGALAFKQFKEELGYRVRLYPLSSIGKSVATLAHFLRRQFELSPYQYAVLVGHQSNMPTHLLKTVFDSKTPSDLPYFLMGGEGDKIPDVHYGRLIAGSNDDLFRQVAKLREYHQRSWPRFAGQHHYLGIASDEGANPPDVQYVEMMTAGWDELLGLEVQTLFQVDVGSTAPRILQSLSTGALWLNYLGHSTGRAWKSLHKGRFHASEIKKMQAGGVKPIIIDISCLSGRFKYRKDNMGERFMNAENGDRPVGAVAYYGGSVDITWRPPALMAVAINHTIKKRRRGQLFGVLLAGQLQMLAFIDDLQAAFENLVWFNLFGDPSLELDF